MLQVVRYKGGLETDDENRLIIGKLYKVEKTFVMETENGSVESYELSGILGRFPSKYFESVQSKLAISIAVPRKSKNYGFYEVVVKNGTPSMEPRMFSKIEAVESLGNNDYKIMTETDSYLLKVTEISWQHPACKRAGTIVIKQM